MFLSFILAAATAIPPAPAIALPDAAKGRLVAVGADPSWNLQIGSDELTLTESIDDDEKITGFKLISASADGGDAHVWRAKGLTVTISAAVCSDGVTSYPYTSELKFAGKKARTLKGCAYRPWGEDVLAALPVIDACLKGEEADSPVFYAAATAPGAGVVLLGADIEEAAYRACVLADGKTSVTPIQVTDAPPGASAEIFIRGPGRNPGGECYDAPEVKDAAGKVVGWWLDPEGC